MSNANVKKLFKTNVCNNWFKYFYFWNSAILLKNIIHRAHYLMLIFATCQFVFQFLPSASLYLNFCHLLVCIPIVAICQFVFQLLPSASLYSNFCHMPVCIPIFAICQFVFQFLPVSIIVPNFPQFAITFCCFHVLPFLLFLYQVFPLLYLKKIIFVVFTIYYICRFYVSKFAVSTISNFCHFFPNFSHLL